MQRIVTRLQRNRFQIQGKQILTAARVYPGPGCAPFNLFTIKFFPLASNTLYMPVIIIINAVAEQTNNVSM